MTTFFQAHLGDEEGVCSDHRNLQTTQPPHQLSGTPGARLVRAPENSILEICFVSLRVCMVSFICICLWRCLFVWPVSWGGWWLLSFPQRTVADKKPSVCCCFSPSGRLPGWRCRPALLLAWLMKHIPVGTRKARRGGLQGREQGGVDQPVKQSQGGRQVSVIETSIESKNTKAGANTQRRGHHALAGRQATLLNNRNTCSFGREGEGGSGVLVDICERTKGGGINLPRQLAIVPRCGLEVRPTAKPEINSNTPPSEKVGLFLKMQAFALKLFQKSKM